MISCRHPGSAGVQQAIPKLCDRDALKSGFFFVDTPFYSASCETYGPLQAAQRPHVKVPEIPLVCEHRPISIYGDSFLATQDGKLMSNDHLICNGNPVTGLVKPLIKPRVAVVQGEVGIIPADGLQAGDTQQRRRVQR